MSEYTVSRDSDDNLTVTIGIGHFRDLVDAEYKRAGIAFNMRPMWYTGSPYGAEIVKLLMEVRHAN